MNSISCNTLLIVLTDIDMVMAIQQFETISQTGIQGKTRHVWFQETKLESKFV